MSSTDEEAIWSKGDVCLAPYTEDGEEKLFKARVKGFQTKGFRQTALVGYVGYGSSNDEEVELKKLKRIKRKRKERAWRESQEDTAVQSSMFSPLQGDEEKKRLQQKFAAYEDEDEDSALLSPRWSTTSRQLLDPITTPSSRAAGRRKATVAIGGQEKKGARSSSSQSSAAPSTPRVNTSVHLSSSEDEGSKDSRKEAFSGEELTRPYFRSVTITAPPTPLVLSAAHRIPAPVNRYLREYQRDGVRFLYTRYQRVCGGILADDMGLGKTVQVISFIAAVLGKTGTKEDIMRQRPKFIRQMSESNYEATNKSGPFLIIGPASVLYNWIHELETWGHFTVGKFHKHWKSSTISDLKREKLEVVVTTYETCRDNIRLINEFEWEAVIADEAHRIKGLKAEVTVALKSLRCLKRFGLTGTPLQNRLEELWCLLDWAVPGCLGEVKSFQEHFVKKIEQGQKADATKRELAEARKAQEKLSGIRDQHMLRRTKALIADQLPKKQELVVACRPASVQVSMYRAVLAQDDMKHILRQHEPCACDSGRTRAKCCHKTTPSGQPVKSLTFTYLNLLLKVANHVALLLPASASPRAPSASSTQPTQRQGEYARKICEDIFSTHPEFARLGREASFRTLSDPQYCGKMKLLTEMLKVFSKQKSKVLLFSYSVRLLSIIEQYVMGRGYEYRRLDGSTPDHRRLSLVQEFNADPSIFLFIASTKAGGMGLNLTGANVVIIFDPNWNPSHDLQAADRAYRLGQSRDVRVYRLVCAGTVEENVYLRQLYKQQLDSVAIATGNARRYFHGVQGDKHRKGELFGLENMFKLRTGDRCMTEDIIKRNRQVEDALSKQFHVEEYIPPPQKPAEEQDSDNDNNDGDRNSDNDDDSVGGEDLNSLCGIDSPSADDEPTSPHPGQSSRSRLQKLDQSTRLSSQKLDQSTRLASQKLDQSTHLASRKRDQSTRLAQQKLDRSADRGRRSVSPAKGDQSTPRKSALRNVDLDEIDVLFDLSVEAKEDLFKMPAIPDRMETKQTPVAKPSPNKKSVKFRRNLEEEFADEDSKTVKQKGISRPGCSDDDVKKDKGKGKGKSSKRSIAEVPEGTMSFESVSDVFGACGVVHSHRSKAVVGGSRAEEHMGRCAVRDVYERHMYTQEPALHCTQMSCSEESDDYGESSKSTTKPEKPAIAAKKSQAKPLKTGGKGRSEMVGNTQVLIGQTPKGIRMCQFREMAETLGYGSVEDLALAVLVGEPHQILEQLYTQQNPELREVVQSLAPSQPQTRDSEKAPKKAGRPKKPPPPKKTPPKKRAPKRRHRPVYSDMSSSDPEEDAPDPLYNPVSYGSDTEVEEEIEKGKEGKDLKGRYKKVNEKERNLKDSVRESKSEKEKESDSKAHKKEKDKERDRERIRVGESKSGKKRDLNEMRRIEDMDCVPQKKVHKTAEESIDAMVNEMFSSPEKTPMAKNSQRKRGTPQKPMPESSKKHCSKDLGERNETFAFLDSVFFD